MKITLPANYNSESLLQKYPYLTEKIKPRRLDYIVHLLIHLMNTKDENLLGYAKINAQKLKDTITYYKQHIDYLCRVGVISHIKPHEAGSHSRMYKLSEEYLSSFKKAVLKPDVFVKSRKKKRDGRIRKKARKNVKNKKYAYAYSPAREVNGKFEFAHLNKWFNKDLKIDKEDAIAFIRENEHAKNDKYKEVRIEQAIGKINKLAKLQYENHKTVQKVDFFGKRYYSVMTDLNKNLKNFLLIKGERAVGLDLKSSLAYILGLVLDTNQPDIHRIANETMKQYVNKGGTTIMLQNLRQSVDPIELQRFLSLVSNEGIYEAYAAKCLEKNPRFLLDTKLPKEVDNKKSYSVKLMKIIGRDVHIIDEAKYNRKAAKTLFVRILSAKLKKEEYYGVFKEMFPTISEFLEKLKSFGDYADSHKCSSMLLQRIESYLVLHVICKEFVHENNAPIYTIHDSMLTALSNLGILRQKAEEVFGRYCSKLPSFHEEWYCDDCGMAA